MNATRALLGIGLACAVLYGCSGSTGGGAAAPAGANAGPTDGGAAPVPPVASGAPAADLPGFMSDFDRVCETQVGYGGAAAYDPKAGVHPVALFYDHGDPPTLIQASTTLPAGWAITEDANYADNAELAGVELVACSRRVAATPNGTKCDFTLNDGGTVTLELTDTSYVLTVYEAASGKQVGAPQTLDAATTECPYIASFKEGDTTYLNEPSDDQYINALKGVVAPG